MPDGDAVECLRDIGVDDEVEKQASTGEKFMSSTRWCYSMAGEEFARIYSWGNDPQRKVGHNLALDRMKNESILSAGTPIKTSHLFNRLSRETTNWPVHANTSTYHKLF